MAVEYVGTGSDDGTTLGRSASDKIAFYGTTTVSQRASSLQATVASSASFGTAAQSLLNELRDALVAVGIIKGSA